MPRVASAATRQDARPSIRTSWPPEARTGSNNNTLQAKKQTFAVQDEGRARDIIADCMGAKGYAREVAGPG